MKVSNGNGNGKGNWNGNASQITDLKTHLKTIYIEQIISKNIVFFTQFILN